MNKIFLCAALALASGAIAAPDTAKAPIAWKEGVHYERLSPAVPTSAKASRIEVVEYFWYGCPHCLR